MFSGRGAAAYRSTHLGSSPQRALVALLERLVRDMDEAKSRVVQRYILAKSELLGHALAIIGELQAALNHELAPETCSNLTRLYDYMSAQLVDGGARLDPTPIENARRVAEQLCQGFRGAVEAGP